MGRMIKPVLCAKMHSLELGLVAKLPPQHIPTAPHYCCRGCCRVGQKETHFTASKLHLSFFHLFSAYLSMLFRPLFKGQIKEWYGKTKETEECFVLRKSFSRVSALKRLPSDFHFVVLGFCVFKHIPLVINTPCAISSVREIWFCKGTVTRRSRWKIKCWVRFSVCLVTGSFIVPFHLSLPAFQDCIVYFSHCC